MSVQELFIAVFRLIVLHPQAGAHTQAHKTVPPDIKAVDNNACLEAVSFVERLKDIIMKNRNVGYFALDFTGIEWGVDILMNAADITVAEISCKYKKINYFTFYYAGDNLDSIEWEERSINQLSNFNKKINIPILALELAYMIENG